MPGPLHAARDDLLRLEAWARSNYDQSHQTFDILLVTLYKLKQARKRPKKVQKAGKITRSQPMSEISQARDFVAK